MSAGARPFDLPAALAIASRIYWQRRTQAPGTAEIALMAPAP